MGGLRRRKERTVAVLYDVGSVRSLGDIQRVLDFVLTDTLNLENSPARGRLLLGIVDTGLKPYEVARFEMEDDER